MDRIVVDLDTDRRECVSCGYSEARPGQGSSDQASTDPQTARPVTELPTRVSRPAARRVETPAEAVRLIDPAE
jgi:hypothetical protein